MYPFVLQSTPAAGTNHKNVLRTRMCYSFGETEEPRLLRGEWVSIRSRKRLGSANTYEQKYITRYISNRSKNKEGALSMRATNACVSVRENRSFTPQAETPRNRCGIPSRTRQAWIHSGDSPIVQGRGTRSVSVYSTRRGIVAYRAEIPLARYYTRSDTQTWKRGHITALERRFRVRLCARNRAHGKPAKD